jgi:hypothetical protein
MNTGNNKSFENKVRNTSNKLSNAAINTSNKLSNAASNVKNTVSTEYKKVSNAVSGSNTLVAVKSRYAQVSSATKDFAEKNSTITKVVFMIFVLIMFGLLFRLGVYILGLFFVQSKNPIILNGMRNTNSYKEYNVHPTAVNPNPILRSINEEQGTEFTWSTWVWIESVGGGYNNGPKVIFTKGKSIEGATYSLNNIMKQYNSDNSSEYNARNQFVMNCPGLYVYDPETDSSAKNVLSVVVPLYDENDSTSSGSRPYDVIPVYNVPLQKWINVVIRVQNRTVDVYVNGTLSKRKNYDRIIKQNYGNIHVGSQSNGMNGYISSLRYFNQAIGNNQIQDIMYQGPNLKMEGEEWNETRPPYLAMRWYLDTPTYAAMNANQP